MWSSFSSGLEHYSFLIILLAKADPTQDVDDPVNCHNKLSALEDRVNVLEMILLSSDCINVSEVVTRR